MAGLLRPALNGHLTQRFGGTSLRCEPKGWFVERHADRALRAFSGPFPGGVERHRVHPGIDIKLDRGTPLVAVEAGIVVRRGRYAETGEKYLKLRIRKGVIAFYTHLRDWRCSEGDIVKRGEVVALSGNTGISTGPHLHFEIRRREHGRLFRYNPRRLFEGRDLAHAPWIAPDRELPLPPPRPTPEDAMPTLLAYQPGLIATIRPEASIHAAPTTAARGIRIVSDAERPVVIGIVEGEFLRGSNRWVMWGAVDGFEYAHEFDVETQPVPPMNDCTEAVTQAVNAAIDAMGRGGSDTTPPDPDDDEGDEPDHDPF